MDPGTNVLIPDPGFVLYKPHTKLMGAEAREYSLKIDNDFRPDVDELKRKVDERTHVMIVNSPSNPTGGMLTRQDRDDMVDLARDNDIVIISDEVYDAMIYTGSTHHSFLGAYEKAVMVNSFSKIFAMTGWRMGFMVASEEMIASLKLAHYHVIACPSTPMQYGALAALKSSNGFIDRMVREFEGRRDLITSRLNEIDGFKAFSPPGTFYSFPEFNLHDDGERLRSEPLAMELASEGLITSPGTTFGKNGEYHLRLSFVNSREQLGKGMDILERVTRKYL